jgi:hypothetical protein
VFDLVELTLFDIHGEFNYSLPFLLLLSSLLSFFTLVVEVIIHLVVISIQSLSLFNGFLHLLVKHFFLVLHVL